LIVNNDEIVNMTYELIKNLITYKSFIEKELLSLEYLLIRNKSLVASFLKLDYKNPNHHDLMQNEAAAETKVQKDIETLKSDFLKNRTSEFLKCRHLSEQFASITKKYLLSIGD
jgi:hypothetical protein